MFPTCENLPLEHYALESPEIKADLSIRNAVHKLCEGHFSLNTATLELSPILVLSETSF